MRDKHPTLFEGQYSAVREAQSLDPGGQTKQDSGLAHLLHSHPTYPHA